jgi:hypothetical protein
MALGAGDCARCHDSGAKHITIVLNDPKGDPPSVVVVNLTSWTRRKEQTVILTPADHPEITKDSVVFYTGAAIVAESFEPKFFTDRVAPASPEMLKKIIAGLLISPEVEEEVLNFFIS